MKSSNEYFANHPDLVRILRYYALRYNQNYDDLLSWCTAKMHERPSIYLKGGVITRLTVRSLVIDYIRSCVIRKQREQEAGREQYKKLSGVVDDTEDLLTYYGLTTQEKTIVRHLLSGRSNLETSKLMGVPWGTFHMMIVRLREKVNNARKE